MVTFVIYYVCLSYYLEDAPYFNLIVTLKTGMAVTLAYKMTFLLF